MDDSSDDAAEAAWRDRLRRIAVGLCALGYALIALAAVIRFLSEGHLGVVSFLVRGGVALTLIALGCALPAFGTWSGRIVVYAGTMSGMALLMLL